MKFQMMIAVVLSLSAITMAGELAEVHSYDDLEKQTSIKINDDCSVRLGIEDESDLGPWQAVYCLTDWKPDAKPKPFSGTLPGDPLGPVFVQIVHPDRREALTGVSMQARKTTLSSVVIPTTRPDRFEIRIRNADGDVLATKEVVTKQQRVCYWHTFAGITHDEAGKWFAAALDSTTAAYPRCGRLTAQTPTTQPAGDSPLVLSLVDKEFHLTSRAGKLRDWPDKNLLARWWMNGKPVVAAPTTRAVLEQEARQMSMSDEIRVRFGLPANLGSVRAGDVIAVQVLYCADGFETMPFGPRQMQIRMQYLSLENAPRLLMSDRLQFKLTPELLKSLPSTTKPATP